MYHDSPSCWGVRYNSLSVSVPIVFEKDPPVPEPDVADKIVNVVELGTVATVAFDTFAAANPDTPVIVTREFT
jgi:hypothetical protein